MDTYSLFNESCSKFLQFPQNLISPGIYEYYLKKYYDKLEKDEGRLFCKDGESVVHLLQLEERAQTFGYRQAKTVDQMKQLLHRDGCRDPISRYFFIQAPNARDRLNITREMLVSALSYLQTMPFFLDFIFTFGRQEYPTDFHFSGFRQDDRLSRQDSKLQIDELGRSGRRLQFCYNLRSVEQSSDTQWPWSIRQTAVYHSFDLVTGQTGWIMVKGNPVIKNRITQATSSMDQTNLRPFQSVGHALAASLATHLILCDWADDSWRWYAGFLEQELQRSTRHTLRVTVDRPRTPVHISPPTLPPTPAVVRRSTMPAKFRGAMTSITPPLQRSSVNAASLSQPAIALTSLQPRTVVQEEFCFSDLQHTQYIEEKANEALLVLKMDANILGELRNYYMSFFESDECPNELKQDCRNDLSQFYKRVSSIINDLEMQKSRLETLLSLLSDRKTLLLGILDYQNMEVNKRLAHKAQVSADRMEKVTEQMHGIAKKTERETVFMRIITLVTLFFLPGTFISTLMSTDIIRFPKSTSGEFQRTYSSEALKLYMIICIPFMVLTFLASFIFYFFSTREDRLPGKDISKEA